MKIHLKGIRDVKKIEHKDKIKMQTKIWDLKLIEIILNSSRIREMEMRKKTKNNKLPQYTCDDKYEEKPKIET